MCATVRLDDDDALSSDYCRILSDLMSIENDNSIVSFSRGYNYYCVNYGKEFVGASVHNHSKIAIGLAYIKKYRKVSEVVNENIYRCGNHAKVGDKYSVIDVDDICTHIRVHTETSDRMYHITREKRKGRVVAEYRKQRDKVSVEEVEERFGLKLLA